MPSREAFIASLFTKGVRMAINESAPKAATKAGYPKLTGGFQELAKMLRQHEERLAAVCLDEHARKLLHVLNKETSIRWENLPDRVESDWSDAARAAALLAGANLCEAGPNRIRISEYGDQLLAASPAIEPMSLEEARSLRGAGWQGNLDEMRSSRVR